MQDHTNYKPNFRNPNINSNRDNKLTTEIKKEYLENIRFCNYCKKTWHLVKDFRKLIYKKNKQPVGKLLGEKKYKFVKQNFFLLFLHLRFFPNYLGSVTFVLNHYLSR